MSWTDKSSIEVIKEIRDRFYIKTFIETGTFQGINSKLHSQNFKEVLTCEINKDYYNKSFEKLKKYMNVHVFHISSPEFLKDFVKRYNKKDRRDIVFVYLDAHFYDKNRPEGKGKFVVLDELKALKGFKKCIIMIHDFHNNLGGITYDGVDLDMKLVKKDLLKVNPNFVFYTNHLASCDIHTEESIKKLFPNDDGALGNIKYARSSPRLTYRGILYAMPQEINIDGLRRWN